MILLHRISGLANPVPAGEHHIYTAADGTVSVGHPDGTIGLLKRGNTGISGLLDVSGVFTSGQAPGWNGTRFVPTSVDGSAASVTYTASGNMIGVKVLLGSGLFANGTSGNITWGSLDQTYEYLEIVGEVHSINAVAHHNLRIYFNGDFTETNYNSRQVQSVTESVSNATANNATAGDIIGTANPGTGNTRATVHKIIPNYSYSPTRKYAYDAGYAAWNYQGGSMAVQSNNMQWTGTAAITQVDVRGNATNVLTSGTYLYLYGHKHMQATVSGVFGPASITNGLVIPQ